jgi:hypothetical protein
MDPKEWVQPYSQIKMCMCVVLSIWVEWVYGDSGKWW